ncbi:MAG: hypothetical protein JJ974_07350 [Phycisphaerales bacterium]|nr:hypothetical protein [Phycisphaerales bacterium]
MKKWTVRFGMPVYVWRALAPYLVVSGLVVVSKLGFLVLVYFDIIPVEWLVDPVFLFGGMFVFLSVVIGSMMVYVRRVGAFQKRLASTRGRVCLRCGYELGEGLGLCSECGARWCVEGLNRGWLTRVERGSKDPLRPRRRGHLPRTLGEQSGCV